MKRIFKTPYNHDGNGDGLRKVNNIGFHPTFLFLFPSLWLISLPLNFVVDSIVLLIGFKAFGKEKVRRNWRRSILLSWIIGYVSDVIAALMMFAAQYIAENFDIDIITNPFEGVIPFAVTLLSVATAGVLIYFFNLKFALSRTELEKPQKKKVALLMALATAPYLFFIPVQF